MLEAFLRRWHRSFAWREVGDFTGPLRRRRRPVVILVTCAAGIHLLPVAAFYPLGGRPLTDGGELPAAVGGFVDQRASDCEPQGLRSGVERFAVHTPAYDRSGGATSSGNGCDISGEVRA